VINRRSILKNTALTLAAPLINRGRFALFAQTKTEYSMRTLDLIRRSTVIDMLGLLTLDFQKLYTWQREPERFQSCDFQKLKDSGTTVFHPAVGHRGGDIYGESLRDMTLWNNFVSRHRDYFVRIDGPTDLAGVKSSGKIGILIGEQNSEHFRSVEDVDLFYRLGQRVSQLTYRGNRIGSGAGDEADGGLSDYGVRIVERMNKLGMAVDVSHCGDRTTLDTFEASQKPVLITHSNCRALVPNRHRCKTDEVIKKMAAKDGVMGITLIRSFVSARGPATIENALDHIDRVARLSGVEHIGIGTDVDLDGRAKLPSEELKARQINPATTDLDQLNYRKKIYDLTEGLVRRRYTDRNIELILGGNFQRALCQIWTA
jgi:membrane dipeptidase